MKLVKTLISDSTLFRLVLTIALGATSFVPVAHADIDTQPLWVVRLRVAPTPDLSSELQHSGIDVVSIDDGHVRVRGSEETVAALQRDRRVAAIWPADLGEPSTPVSKSSSAPAVGVSAVPLETIIIVLDRTGRHPELDLEEFGARHLQRWSDRVVLELPEQAIQAISQHPAVRYIQRTRENLSRGENAVQSASQSQLIVNALSSWTTGTYRYDGSGNIMSIGPSTHGVTDQFYYDDLGRLRYGTAHTDSRHHTANYRYDGFGNLIRHTIDGIESWSDADAYTNRLAPAAGYSILYDAVGNLTSRNDMRYIWDGLGSMTQIENLATEVDTSFVYGIDDQRLLQCRGPQNCEWTFRGFDNELQRRFESVGLDNGGNIYLSWVESVIWAGGQTIASIREDAEGGDRRFHTDHLGSVRMVTNEYGEQISTHDYLPFGVEVTSLSQEQQRGYSKETLQRYTGHERDYLGGTTYDNRQYLDSMHARYYSPVMGRFLSVDPTWESADLGKPQTWNRYAYVMNNPVNLTDPDGKCPLCFEVLFELLDGSGPMFEKGMSTDADKPPRMSPEEYRRHEARTFQTYTKTNPETGEVYSGRTSGTGTPEQNVARRDAGHHRNAEGYDRAQLDQTSPNKDAIRGREQQLIDANGGARSRGGTSGNAIDGISHKNPKKTSYLKKAAREFGDFLLKMIF